jgi:hypothetical protein
MVFHTALLAYVAPEVVLPVASALAGVIGFAMMVGRAPVLFVARRFRSLARGVRSIAHRGTRPPQAS